jgi:hypothetical protein
VDKAARDKGIYEAYRKHGYAIKEIADYLNLRCFTICGIIKKDENY